MRLAERWRMTPQTTSQPRTKGEAHPRKSEEALRLEIAKRNLEGGPRTHLLPEEDKYFDVPCTD